MIRFLKKIKIKKKLNLIDSNTKIKFLIVLYMNGDVQFEIYRQIMFSDLGVKVDDDSGFAILVKRENLGFQEESFKNSDYYENALEVVLEDTKFYLVFCEGSIGTLNKYFKNLKIHFKSNGEKGIKEELSVDLLPDDVWFAEEVLKEVIYPPDGAEGLNIG